MKTNDIMRINQLFKEDSDKTVENMLMGSLASHDFTGMKRTFFITRLDTDGNIQRKFHESCQKVFGHSKEELEREEPAYFYNVVLDEIVNEKERIKYRKSIKQLLSGEIESSSLYFNIYKHQELKGYYFDATMIINNENEKVWITYITDVSNLNSNKFVLNESLSNLGLCVLRIQYNTESNKFNNHANDVFYELLGLEKDLENPLEYVKQKVKKDNNSNLDEISLKMKDLVDGKEDYIELEVCWTKGDDTKWFQVNVVAVARVEKEISLFASIFDITTTKHLKESLVIKNHQLEAAFELTKSHLQVYSPTEQLVSIQSKRFIDKFRIKEEDYLKLGPNKYQIDWKLCLYKYFKMSKQQLANIETKMSELALGKIKDFEIIDTFSYTGKGHLEDYHYRLVCSVQPDGQLLMVLSDLTDKIEREKELNRIKKMFDDTTRAAKIGAFYIDFAVDEDKVYAEDSTASLLGIKLNESKTYSVTEWLNSNIEITSTTLTNVRKSYEEMAHGRLKEYEFTFEKVINGKTRHFNTKMTNVQREDGKVLYIPGLFVDVTSLVESERRVYEQSIIDIVTQGFNRNKYIGDLENGYLENRFVVYGNVNRFQHVNDFYGHEIGDWFLRELASRLEFEKRFTVYRIGADAFVLAANEEITYKEFKEVQKSLRSGLYNEVIGINFNADITFACFNNLNEFTSSEASVFSEKAIERARDENRQTIFVTDDFMSSITSDLLINYKLVNAVKDKDLFPYYQPIHDVKTGKVYAVEILARWDNDGEIVSAFKFIDLINRLKVIDLLDMQMLEKAQEFYKRLITHNQANNKISFTFNASKLSLTKFAERKEEWEKLITNNNIPKDKLILELTEEIKIDEEIRDSINWMNDNNLYVAVDDYGSGESNISSLADPIIDFVKLDMSVLPKDKFDEKKNLILESFVSMFHRLGKAICIEGIETVEQLEIVKKNNIELAQGFFFSKPLSEDDLIKYLDKHEVI